jgi:hypothetical protein
MRDSLPALKTVLAVFRHSGYRITWRYSSKRSALTAQHVLRLEQRL